MAEGGSALVTILFTDLVGSTELLARAGDEDAQRIFRAHHDVLAQAAMAHAGEEVKWLGDGLMVAFASAADALRCAVAMQRAARRPVHGQRLGIRVGLNAGETLKDATDYFGLPVVVARRLCDRAEGGQILCTDVVAGLLVGRPDFHFVELGKLDLKGVPQPVSAFAVDYQVDGGGGVPSRLPFVGREAELGRLRERWRAAHAGHGGLVLVSGEPGIGKTRLVEELAELAAGEGAQVVWGHCFEGEWMPAYAAFAEVIEALVVTTEAEDLRADVGTAGPPLAKLVPALGKVIADLPEAVPLPPQEERFRLLDSLTRLLVARSARRPLLVGLDDLHWADRGSIDALRHLARQCCRHRLLLVGTYRQGDTGRDHPLSEALGALRREAEYDRVALVGLGVGEVGQLLDCLAEHDVPEAVAIAIATESDGNPFFIRELLRHLVEEGKVYRGPDGRWTSEVAVAELGLPEGVREVIERRLARLSTSANRLLATACAFEGSFRLDVAAAAAGLVEPDALDALDEALAAQLLQPGGSPDSYSFTHALIRHTLYASLSPSRQVRLHREVARQLEIAAGTTLSPSSAGEIAAQYHRSRSLPGAQGGIEPALAAARHAEGTGGQAEAARFLRLALDLLPEGDPRQPQLLGRLGMALIWSLAFQEGFTVAVQAAEAINALDGPEAAADYLAGAALALGAGGNNPEAWELARLGLRYTGDRRDTTWARLVVLDLQRREWEDAAHPGIPLDTPERWEAARILRAANPDPAGFGALEAPFESRAEVLTRSGNYICLACYAGDFARCVPLAREEAEQSIAGGRLIRAARCFMVVGICLGSLGQLNQGRAAFDRAAALIAPAGAPIFGIMHGYEMLDASLDDEGALRRLASDFAGLLPTLVPGQAWAVGPATAILARTAARLGHADEALGYLDQLVPWLERAPAWTMHFPQIAGYAAEALWLLGRLDHVDVIEAALREKVLAPDFRDMEMDARLSLARLCTLRGGYDEALSWFTRARQILAEQGARPLLAMVDYDEAHLRRLRDGPGDCHRADELLQSARRQFQDIGMVGWARRVSEQ